ncbi:phosphotransferase [Georgenia faecalis]|uniref:Phosphotransferase n=1 Tax=Georgenia faecalis TaxID=2483799 RepID=A0ABV9DBD9_9MICO|nr:phosphotransferase [Georgenia faecalis]
MSTVPEWTPERIIDARLAAAVVAEQFPDLAGLPVRPFGAGWDNVLFAVGDDWLFRFIHRAIALPGARRELAVLTELANSLPLPIPYPERVGRPTAEVEWPFWGARHIPGKELAEAGLADEARVEVARGVGTFLRALHDPALARRVATAAEAAGAALRVDPMRRGDPASTAERARGRLEVLEAAGVAVPRGAIEELFAVAEPVGASVAEPVLVHGDLHVRHVLVEAGAASGVVDWGDTALADPSVDLMIAYAAFPGPARAAFFDAYGPVDGDTELRARALAVHVSATLLDYAVGEGMTALAAEASEGLRRAAQ